jgi:hypothetical protein
MEIRKGKRRTRRVSSRQEGMKCPDCGAEVKSDDLFCPDCGKGLTARGAVSVGVRRWPFAVAVVAVGVAVCIGGAFITGLVLRGGRTASPGSSPSPTWSPSPTLTPTAPPTPVPTENSPTTVPMGGPDPQEPDDSIAEAAPITTDGRPQEHNLHIEGDQDYLCFEASGGNAYTMETQDLRGDIDPIMYLYDSEEQELAHNDDGSAETLAPRIVWVAPSSGRYYVMVRDLGGDSTGIDANYSITVRESAFAEGADQYEPDDSPAQASAMESEGTRQEHTFHTSTDVDYVSFAAEEGVEYTIQTGGLQAGCDTIIYLYDEAGTELEYDDDAGSETYASSITWTAPSSGLYCVAVRDFGGLAGPDISYEVWILAR